MPQRELLVNSDDNLCFGCGPTNPMGLKLEFWREGDRVLTECTPSRWWSGQPGVVNPGILYAILIDLVIWESSAVLNRVPLLPKAVDLRLGDVKTEVPLAGSAWIVRHDVPVAQIRAEIRQEGDVRAWIEMETRSVSRTAYQKARPFVRIPESLDCLFEEETRT